jgi:hypothetical protein
MSMRLRGAAKAGVLPALVLGSVLLTASDPAIAGHIDLSGHVTIHASGQAAAGVRVSITEPASPFSEVEIGSATTDAGGYYAWSGDCGSIYYCAASIDDPPYMPVGQSFGPNDGTVLIDFALTLPASASGTVRFPAGDASALWIEAWMYSAEKGEWGIESSAHTDADGRFTIERLPPGTYRFCTDTDAGGAVPQCFDHVDMSPIAGESGGTAIDIAEGDMREGIDFDLAPGGTLSGTILDGYLGAPADEFFVSVDVYDANGTWLDSGGTGDDGSFRIVGLPDGTYYLGIALGPQYRDGTQFYPGVVCDASSCPPPTAGAPLTIANGAALANLDFTVHPDVVVRGRVVDADSGEPIGGVEIDAPASGYFAQTYSDFDTGEYVFYLPADDEAEIHAHGPRPYIDTIYPGASCIGYNCVGDVTPVSAPAGSILTGIDVAMKPGAIVSGTITNADTGEPGYGYVFVYDAAFNVVWKGATYGGSYASAPWLPGTYYVQATGQGLLEGCAFYDARPFPADDGDPGSVDPTPIVIAGGEVREGIDFRFGEIDAIFADGFE